MAENTKSDEVKEDVILPLDEFTDTSAGLAADQSQTLPKEEQPKLEGGA